MMKTIMGVMTLFLLLGTTTIISAEETLPNSTTEWLEDTVESDDFASDGCYCG